MQPQLHREIIDGTVLLLVHEPSLPMVHYMVTSRPGAAADPEGRSGCLNTLLELSLRGTRKRSRKQFAADLEELGSTAVATVGASAGFVRGVCLSRHLDPTLALLQEALLEPKLNESELSQLLGETIDDLRAARDDDDTVAEIFARKVFYEGHPLARSTVGEIEDLKSLSVAELRTLHENRLARDRYIIALGGDITVERARKFVRDLHEGMGTSTEPLPTVVDPAPTQGQRVVLVDKPERVQAQLRVGCLLPSGLGEDILPLWLGIVAFGGTFTSPFSHAVREERGWSYIAHAGYDRHRLYKTPLVLASAPSTSDMVPCLALEFELFAQLAAGEVSTESVELARSYILNRFPFRVATAPDIMVASLQYELLGRPPQELFLLPEKVQSVTHDQVVSALREHLCQDDVSCIAVVTAADVHDALASRLPNAILQVRDYRQGVD